MYINKDGGSNNLCIWKEDLDANGTFTVPEDVRYFFENDCHCGDALNKLIIPENSKVILSGWSMGPFTNNDLKNVVVGNVQYCRIANKFSSNGYMYAYLVPKSIMDARPIDGLHIYQAREFRVENGALSDKGIFVCDNVNAEKLIARGMGQTKNDAVRDCYARQFDYKAGIPSLKMASSVSVNRANAFYSFATCYNYKAKSQCTDVAEVLRACGMVSEKSGAVKIKNLSAKEFLCRMSVVYPKITIDAVDWWNYFHNGEDGHGPVSEQVSFDKTGNGDERLCDCMNCGLIQKMMVADVGKKCAFAKEMHR